MLFSFILTNHVIAEHQVTSEIHCGHRCMRESKCVSFNYEDHNSSLPHVCELSDELMQNDLQSFMAKDGFSYFELKEPFLCNAVSCHNGGQCVEQCDGHPKCICAVGYTGEHCEHRLSIVSNVTSTTSSAKNNATYVNTTDGYENAESCLALKLAGVNSDGLYLINLSNTGSVEVLCDQQTDGGGWTIIQRRTSPFWLNFDRNWTEYKFGFGNLQGEFWLGNKIIHRLLKMPHVLRIELKTRKSRKFGFAEYSRVTMDGPNNKYRLKISGYHGNISDCGGPSNWQYFTTRDADNDKEPSKNCATEDHAGWWYKDCGCGNLNRQSGPKWDSWYIGKLEGIVFSEIKIR
ncbi:Fibrinogen C domain-containing protein 1 [Desmophyllum pertusum]|uniref:Fibrinogen C domain-containing protein 1 n=1 Tax=Desmophyllum pertusum TaxID=174260 RepID=A0A9W9Z3F7_9CNID|nr:Fibrinogen C domain-containing protein 1 [Desmophyllum pertusum]